MALVVLSCIYIWLRGRDSSSTRKQAPQPILTLPYTSHQPLVTAGLVSVYAGGCSFRSLDKHLLLASLALLCPLTFLDNASNWTPQKARPLCLRRWCDLPDGLRTEEDTALPTTRGLKGVQPWHEAAEISCVS